MKHLLFLLLSVFLLSCNSKTASKIDTTKVSWLSLEEAAKQTKKKPKKILVDMYTEWCGPCKMMDRQTFNDPEVIQFLNENFYSVKFNAESPEKVSFNGKDYGNPRFDPNRNPRGRNSPHEFSSAMGIRGYPTLLVFDSELNVITQLVGFQDKGRLLSGLKNL